MPRLAGRYRIRVKGYTIWVSGGGVDHWNYDGFWRPKGPLSLYRPPTTGPTATKSGPGRRNEPIGIYAQSSGQSRPLGAFDFTPEPSVGRGRSHARPNEAIQTDAMRFFRTRVNGSEEEYVNPLARARRHARRCLPVVRSRRPARRSGSRRWLPADVRRPAPAPSRPGGRAASPCNLPPPPLARLAVVAAAAVRACRMSPSRSGVIIPMRMLTVCSVRSWPKPTVAPFRKRT